MQNTKLRNHSVEHIKHGVINVFAGVWEAIPFVGCYFSCHQDLPHRDEGVFFIDETTRKKFPYHSLKGKLIEFYSDDSEVSKRAAQKFYEDSLWQDNVEERIAIAQVVCDAMNQKA